MQQPKSRNILAFLTSKNWTVAETTPKYFLLKPPPYIQFEDKFRFRIPRTDAGDDTPGYLIQLTSHIADMYELDKFELMALFSKSPVELKHEIEIEQKSLEMKRSFYSAFALAS